MESMIERVAFAMDYVNLVFSCGDHTGMKLKWVIWDRNRDTDDALGWVWIGRDFKEGDKLDDPYGEAFWKLKDFKARAAIEAMREPTEEMIAASNREWDGRMSHRSSGAWQAMIDAALSLEPATNENGASL